MKILVIDYLSYRKHMNFNRIHINTLVNLGHSLCLVGRDGQFSEYEICPSVTVTVIPERYYRPHACKPISIRLSSIFSLLWIKKHIDLFSFDLIVFPTYDIMSLCFFRTSIHTLLINHNNVGQLDNRIKLKLTKSLPVNYQHITLSLEMTTRMKELLPQHDIKYIPHGIINVQAEKDKQSADTAKYFICPINRNFEINFCRTIFDSPLLHDYLEQNDIFLYVKKQLPFSGTCNRIKIIDNNIEYQGYINLLRNSVGVILPYSIDFKYRCSGIFFECVAYDIPIIARDISAFNVYKENIGLFSDVDSLLKSLSECLKGEIKSMDRTVFQPEPYWRQLLNEFSNIN